MFLSYYLSDCDHYDLNIIVMLLTWNHDDFEVHVVFSMVILIGTQCIHACYTCWFV
jgi:hypothetical protein